MTSINRDNGYLLVDNRGTDGVPDELLRQAGMPIGSGRGLFEAASVHCKHCGGHFIKNPEYDGKRKFCRPCNHYVCNPCARAMDAPGYAHRTFEEVANLVMGGSYTLAPGSTGSVPILIPTGD